MAQFPGALPAAGASSASDTLAVAGHTSLHNTAADEARAIATKVGTGASTPVAGTVLRGTGAGTSAYGQVALASEVSGILPVASGGTGQGSLTSLTLPSAVLANPAVSGTVSGGATYTSPTLTTPTIGDFTNATHDHSNAAGGGTLGSAAITGIDKSVTTTDSNPYKFHAFATATQNLTGTNQVLIFESEAYDTNSDYDTSNGRYTAPVNGFYWFHARDYIQTLADQNEMGISLYKNGSSVGNQPSHSSGSFDVRTQITLMLQLSAGDYIQVYTGNSQGTRNHLGATATGLNTSMCFMGFLISRT